MKSLLLILINSITRTYHITVCECSFEAAYLHSDTCELQDLDCFISLCCSTLPAHQIELPYFLKVCRQIALARSILLL